MIDYFSRHRFKPLLSTKRLLSTILLSLLLVSGCGQLPQQRVTLNNPALLEHWSIKAKLGVRTDTNSGSVTLKWTQHKDNYHIQLQGPLGQGKAVIHGNNHTITMEQPGKLTQTSTQVSALAEHLFGWPIPIRELPFWVKGIAAPHSVVDKQIANPSGTLISLEQSQWSINYRHYHPPTPRTQTTHTNKHSWALPKRMQAEHDNIRLTFIIKEWTLL